MMLTRPEVSNREDMLMPKKTVLKGWLEIENVLMGFIEFFEFIGFVESP
jgi:hypothetical protein